MDLAEDFVKSITRHVIEHCQGDLDLFARFVDTGLMDTLKNVTRTSTSASHIPTP